MKKIGAILILISFALLISINSLISAQDLLEVDEGSEADEIMEGIGKIPITKEGVIDEEKIAPWKSKAEERIAKVNEELKKSDPFFMFVFEIPLRASWQFIYLFFVVLISFSFFHNIPNWFGADKEWLNLVLGFGTTFALGKLKVYLWIVNLILKITGSWWWKMIVIAALIILVILVTGIGSLLKQMAEKSKEKAESKKLKEESKEVREVSSDIEDISSGMGDMKKSIDYLKNMVDINRARISGAEGSQKRLSEQTKRLAKTTRRRTSPKRTTSTRGPTRDIDDDLIRGAAEK